MEELKDAIDQLRVENSEYRSFIPQGPLCQLLARDKIENISRTIPSASQQMVQEDVITVVVSGAMRIFAILIVCNHPEHIIDFIKALDQFQPSGLDHRLPFHIDTLRRILPNTRAEKFHKVQWEFSTPHLSTTGIPRCLEPQIVLPFTKNQRLAEGGFGVVYSVEINAEYHRLEISDSRKPLSSSGVTSLIRKELLPHAKDLDFEVELRNLSLLKLLKHPNIVRLLSCYTYRGTHNLVFPRASGGDLGELLLNDRPEAFKRNETFISALSGLASALHHVHHFVAEILDVDLIGCHHDLKPKNILVDGDCLLLADFGLSRFKLESDGSKTPYRQRNGYELAPECQDLDDEGETHEVSRASDIWSFGCILANMLIYMKEGPEGINSFKTARKFRHGRTTYYYFHCGDEPNEKMHAWLNKLEPSCTISERFLLQLVRKMLVLDPQARPDSGYVMASLQFATLHALSQPIQTRFRNLRDAISTSQAKTEILIEKQRFLSWQWALGLVDNEQRPIEELQFDSKFEQFDSIVSTLSMLQQVLDCFDISLGNPRRRLVLPSRQLNGSLLAFLDPMMQSRANNFLKIVLLDTEDLEYLGYLAQFGSVGGVRGLADTKRKTLRISSIDSLPSSPIDLANSQLLDDYQISMLLKGSSSRVYSISGDKVLFERGAWDDRFTHEIILQRIRDTTTLLTMIPSNPSIHILRCRGFCQQPDPGIIYDFPPNMQEPNAQIGTLRWFLDQRSRTSYPDLGSRFTLASRLASTVLAFHQASWLHKSLSASNITFFWLSGAPIASVLCEPYVLGFMHSRPDDANSFTESPVYSEEDKDYVHPDYLDNDERFEPLFDYYSLGLILFEIGMWRRLSKRLVGVSLKMYFDLPSTEAYLNALSTAFSGPPRLTCDIFVLPSLPAVSVASTILSSKSQVWIGAQNCHWEDTGAQTGEVSPLMLKQLGCTIVELGHAERRRSPFNETDEIIARKAQAAMRNNLIPLICIGEKSKSTIMSQGVGLALQECVPQVTAMLNAVPDGADLIFAYEPIWAIGAQEPASADHVLAVVGELRKKISERGRSGEVRILYGGSAKPGTWDDLKGGLDGLFLGRFAHDVDAFKKVVEEISVD